MGVLLEKWFKIDGNTWLIYDGLNLKCGVDFKKFRHLKCVFKRLERCCWVECLGR